MMLFAYFDGATGPVRPVGWTNYDEDYAATECARQERREKWPYEGDGNDWLRGFQERCRRLAELCEAMRKATEQKT